VNVWGWYKRLRAWMATANENATRNYTNNTMRLVRPVLGSVDTFKTNAGPVTVSWILDSDDYHDLIHNADELLPADRDDLRERLRKDQAYVRTKIADVLKGHPATDFTHEAQYLGIIVEKVSRREGRLIDFEAALEKARTLVEANRIREQFLRENNIEEGSELEDQVNIIFSEYEMELKKDE